MAILITRISNEHATGDKDATDYRTYLYSNLGIIGAARRSKQVIQPPWSSKTICQENLQQ